MTAHPESLSSNLRGLIALARKQGVDIRPTLLRVLTDLYVQQPEHSAEETARFAELAGRLLDAADPELRATVAGKLAACADAPHEVLLKLAHDTFAVAEPVLRQSRFEADDLERMFATLGPDHRQAIAARADLPLALAGRLGEITRSAAGAFVRARADREARDVVAHGAGTVPEHRIDFALRRPVRAALSSFEAPPLVPAVPSDDALAHLDGAAEAAELERLALQRRPHAFAERLSASFGFAPEVADRITHDPTGEAVAAVCRAIDMPCEAFSRIVLFLNPEIGRSVAKVFALAEYYAQLAPASARELCATWRHSRLRAGARHQPYTAEDAPVRGSARPAATPVGAAPVRDRLRERG